MNNLHMACDQSESTNQAPIVPTFERLESVNADLLAALQACLTLLTDGDAEPSDADRVTAIVRAAIARATGEQS